jgi:tetratricopeptide (TPR) repeat protein
VTVQARRLVAATIVGLVVAAAFLPTLGNGFVDYDDGAYLFRNGRVAGGLTLSGAAWALTSLDEANWHPVTWLSHMADVSLFGLDPRGHHFVSLALHGLTAGLLFLTLRALTGSAPAALAAACLFGLHPLRVESVAWASERKDLLAGFFWIASLAAWLAWLRRPAAGRYLAALFLCALGLASKPTMVTFPAALLLLDWWPLGRWPGAARARPRRAGRLVLEKAPFLAMSAAAALLTLAAQRAGGAVTGATLLPGQVRAANAVAAAAGYLGKTFWPSDLAFFYPYPADPTAAGRLLPALALLAGISLLAYGAARRLPFAAFGWSWFLVTLLPMSGLVQAGLQSMADRYTYLPHLGLFPGLVLLVSSLAGKRPAGRRVLAAGALSLALLCFGLTWAQTRVWRDSRTLFTHAARVTRGNWLALQNLGHLLLLERRPAEALPYFEEAGRHHPDDAILQKNWGSALAATGRGTEAVAHYRRALALRAGFSEAGIGLGNALSKLGNKREALEAYRQVLRGDPGNVDALYNLGWLHLSLGEWTQARDAADRLAGFSPGPGTELRRAVLAAADVKP